MPLAITEEHRDLADTARDFAASRQLRQLTREAFGAGPRAGDAVWREICQLGWPGAHLPDDVGGGGGDLTDLAVIIEQFGAACAPAELLATTIASATLSALAPDAGGQALLRRLACGELTAAVDVTGGLTATGSTVTGRSGPAIGGSSGSVFVARASGDVAIFLTDQAGVAVEPAGGLDPGLRLGRVRCDGVPAILLPGGAALLARVARALACCEAAGGAQATLEMGLAYARTREQFGRTIGSFQAVKHRLADMLVAAEKATAVAWDAVRMALADDEHADLAVAAAAATAFRGYWSNAEACIQVHGGIGFTWEHDAHLYLRRAVALAAVLGPVDAMYDQLHDLGRAAATRRYGIDLPLSADKFRTEARAFAAAYHDAPADGRRRLLVESGYLVPHWPRPWGRAAGPVEQLVLAEELSSVPLPELGIGEWVMYTLTQFATAEQAVRWVRPGLLGDLLWCQLFSEPNAGSDAASVRASGTRADGGWLVNGQKVWISDARLCQRGLATVRTGPAVPKHQGITAMVINLAAPGLRVRALRDLTGDAIFNEVFFDDVFVPDEDVVGAVNGGWEIARATLGNERVSIGGQVPDRFGAANLRALLEQRAGEDRGFRREIGRLLADEHALRVLGLRRVARAVAGADPGAEGSVTKLQVAEYVQRVSSLALRVCGPAVADDAESDVVWQYLYGRAATIAGGTSEISRNVIAERLLGLPRDPLTR
jgi:alkylation response protein AidB-like acyl-CoA dehydrogenase